mgnify:CR=1 FL=1
MLTFLNDLFVLFWAGLVDHEEHKKEVLKKEVSEYERVLSDNSFTPDGHVTELHGQNELSEFITSHKKVGYLYLILSFCGGRGCTETMLKLCFLHNLEIFEIPFQLNR